MNNIKWGPGAMDNSDVKTGWTDLRKNCYLYFIFNIQPDNGCMLDTLTTPHKWDNIDMQFASVQEAKDWAEAHYALFKHEFKKMRV